ncbi:MAG: polyprenol monophosphomannose synthase [Candidatus Kapaibacteriales bacterium]
MKSLIIIPTYNEAENIENLLKKIFDVLPEANILIVDDNSPDGTASIVQKLMSDDSRISLIQRPGKMGLGTAYITGFRYALEHGYDAIFEMDGDFSHNPEDLPRFLEALENADLVIGSRYLTGVNVINWPLQRLFLSYFANVYTQVITGMPIRDATGGFKCFRAQALSKIDLDSIKSNGYGFQIEMNFLFWAKGFRVVEIPIIFTDRRNGVSKMNKKIILEAILLVWKLKFKKLFNLIP